jgi:hypothetical protein
MATGDEGDDQRDHLEEGRETFLHTVSTRTDAVDRMLEVAPFSCK